LLPDRPSAFRLVSAPQEDGSVPAHQGKTGKKQHQGCHTMCQGIGHAAQHATCCMLSSLLCEWLLAFHGVSHCSSGMVSQQLPWPASEVGGNALADTEAHMGANKQLGDALQATPSSPPFSFCRPTS
jgi:hypothetical protein